MDSAALDGEPTDESRSTCECCGHETRGVWRFVHEPERTIACYFFEWAVGMPFDSHAANFDLIYGAWGDTSTNEDLCAIGPGARGLCDLRCRANSGRETAVVVER